MVRVQVQHLLALSLMVVAMGHASHGARILGIFPFPAPSHLIVLTALTDELARRGHEVTIVSSVPLKKPNQYHKEITVDVRDRMMGPIDMYGMTQLSVVEMMLMLWGMGTKVCELVLPDAKVQELIHSKEKFDLIVMETFFNECFLGFSHTFQAPIIQICPFGGAEWMGDAVGNPNPYSYVPDFNLHYDDHMSFFQRTHNMLVGTFEKLGRAVYYLPKQNALIQKYFSGSGPGPVPHVKDIDTKTSFMFVNTHVSISNPRPYMPNMIEVGGMHINPPKKLPQDLQKYMDDSTAGVVYFSMGSNLKSSEMPVEKLNVLLGAFAKLKQNVLWKWETDTLPGQPKNVKLSKWLPQSDLLAHPNIKVFFTHGGLLSTQEALYHGVPIIGMPIFGDQPMNMNRAVSAGYALRLDFTNLTTDALSAALDQVINNPKFREKAKSLSSTFRDQPHTPLETAVFWTEYTLRHKGAYHLRSAAMDLYWYEYYLLDVLALLGAVALASLLATYLILRTICRCICPTKKSSTTTASKKKN